MTTADKVARFFGNSPKRQLELENWIDSMRVKNVKGDVSYNMDRAPRGFPKFFRFISC